jgi:hypothetical protein
MSQKAEAGFSQLRRIREPLRGREPSALDAFFEVYFRTRTLQQRHTR